MIYICGNPLRLKTNTLLNRGDSGWCEEILSRDGLHVEFHGAGNAVDKPACICLFFRLSNVNDKCNRERATNGPWPLNVQRPLYSLCSFEPATVRQNLVQAALRSTSKHLLCKCVPNCMFGYPTNTYFDHTLDIFGYHNHWFFNVFQLAPSGRVSQCRTPTDTHHLSSH